MHNRNYRDTALTWFALGILTGLLGGLASCNTDTTTYCPPTTTVGQP